MPDVTIDDLTVEYQADGYTTRPLDGLRADIGDGKLVLLLGPSGCGKTTLLSCLGGLLRPASGRILVGVREITRMSDEQLRDHRRERVGFIFQSFNLIASLNARDNVAAPLVAQGVSRRLARQRADRVLAEVGLAGHLRSRPGQLSGGQQQRVAVARGLVHDPEVLLADEPTANLDYVQTESVVGLLRGLARPGRIVVVSTHDDRLLPIADAVIDLTPDVDDRAPHPEGPLRLAAGEVLFHQGERGALVYVVEQGEIEVVRRVGGHDQILARVEPGQYVGELGPMLGQPRSASARASTESVVRAMSLQEFRVRSRHHAPILPTQPNPPRNGSRRRTPLVARADDR